MFFYWMYLIFQCEYVKSKVNSRTFLFFENYSDFIPQETCETVTKVRGHFVSNNPENEVAQ